MVTHELLVDAADVRLAGTLHLPEPWPPGDAPRRTLLMVPGSGPSDRDNDVYFPPIRERLLEASIAVASFDKRGVGASTGDRLDGGPTELAADVQACLRVLRGRPELDAGRVGLFGHSQGGWVVLEATAADPEVAFVITNSGPGVTPAAQERYAVVQGMRAAGESDGRLAAVLATFDDLVTRIRSTDPLATFADLAADPDLARHTLVPPDEGVLRMMRAWVDHDPRRALEAIAVPLLAVFGSMDRVVPVEASLGVMRAARAGRRGGLSELVIEGGDHRCLVGSPPTLPERYLRALVDWILARA